MKKILTSLTVLMFAVGLWAQPPQLISYQAVVRDANDALVTNAPVGMQISVLEDSPAGAAVYTETQVPTSNANGLVSIIIGAGSVVSGDMATIDWSADDYFLRTEIDPSGGTAYSITGTSQLLSVPYAFHAKSAEMVTGALQENDPLFGASVAAGITGDDTLNWNNKLDAEEDGSVTNELQALSLSNDTVFLSDGGFVKLPFIGPGEADANDLITFDGSNWVARGALSGNAGGGQSQNNMQPWLGIYHIIALQGIFPSRSSADPFLAEIIMFAGNFAPRGWAFCDGQLLPIAQNQAVFSLLGTTFGGDGRTTFALPDLRGRTAVHPGNGPGLTTRRWGEKGGSETNTMTVNQMPSHTHTITYQ